MPETPRETRDARVAIYIKKFDAIIGRFDAIIDHIDKINSHIDAAQDALTPGDENEEYNDEIDNDNEEYEDEYDDKIDNSLSSVAGKSLTLPPTREHDAIGGPSGISLSPPRVLREQRGGKSTHSAARSLIWVDGTLACYHRGGKAIAELGPSFLANLVFSHPPSANDGGERRLGGKPCMPRNHQRLAFTMSTFPGFADKNPWVMKAVKAVARELQCWYRRHSIRRYLARQTRRRLAATTLQCWKRCIWLDRWFSQQYLQRQKRLRLQSLCRGASAYAMLVRGDRLPPPTPTDKHPDPKVLHHPFRERGLPLPPRRRA
jgi:hypothetical protein